ncbi:MAG TPA: hypothetical protein VLF42_09940 [Burkholderiales bacterium]|nr:hypothetical protein [Burkholderiales bacterium]
MSRRDTLVAACLIALGCLQMAGDVLRLPAVKAIGAATSASPAPKVFTAQDGFETYANRFFLEWRDAGGAQKTLELTPEVYAALRGPYNRRNIFGAVFSYAPVLDANPLTQPMFRAVLERSFCGGRPAVAEIGVPPDAAKHGPVRIRLEPRRAPGKHDFALTHEVRCSG